LMCSEAALVAGGPEIIAILT